MADAGCWLGAQGPVNHWCLHMASSCGFGVSKDRGFLEGVFQKQVFLEIWADTEMF